MTILEFMISMVLTALVSLAMIGSVRRTLSFTERSERSREARSVARSGVQLLERDLSSVLSTSVGTSPIELASGTSVTVRVPIAMGVLCAATGSSATISLLPVDSVSYAAGAFAGAAYRASNGEWTYLSGVITPAAGVASTCTASSANVTTLGSGVGATSAPAGRVISITSAIPAATSTGTLVLLYRRLRFDLAPSTDYPGRTALWRSTLGATGTTAASSLELASPLNASSTITFFVGTTRVPQTAVPSDLRTIAGLEFVMIGESESAGRDGAARAASTARMSVFFRNRTS